MPPNAARGGGSGLTTRGLHTASCGSDAKGTYHGTNSTRNYLSPMLDAIAGVRSLAGRDVADDIDFRRMMQRGGVTLRDEPPA